MPELPLNNTLDTPAIGKTADEIADFFSAEDTETQDDNTDITTPKRTAKPEKEEKVEGEEADDEIKLIEPDEEIEQLDLDDKQVEDLDIAAPPRKKEIVKKYPEIFKDFPFLEKMLYRDKEYNELFGSFDDAKEIAEKADVFKELEGQLMAGDTASLLSDIKETDPKAFDIIVDDYLVTLHKVDKEAYQHVVGNMNKRLIAEMWKEAKATNNEELQNAAVLVNQFVFGTSTYSPPVARVDRTADPKDNEANNERLAFVRERFETSRDDMQTRVDNTLKSTISEYIDPKGVMTPFVKKHAVAEAMRTLTDTIAADGGTVKGLDKLWRAAFEAKFSKESLGRIQSFYLGKARVGLKNAILKARAEALKNSTPAKETEAEEVETPRRGRIETGRTFQPKSNKGMKPGESVADFFARD